MGIIDNSTLSVAVDCNQVFSTNLLRIRDEYPNRAVCRNFAKGERGGGGGVGDLGVI